jgi:hypothetical protein
MRRRALLSSLAAGVAGLAGCAESGTESTTTSTTRTTTRETTRTTTTTDDTSPPDPPDRYASVVELETGPRTYAFRPTRLRTDDRTEVALWFEQTATADHPAVLRGWLQNADDFENTVRVEWIPAVGRTHARQPRDYDHEARLHLAPTQNNELAIEAPHLVRDESGYWRVEDVGPWMPETYRMDPGEVVDLEYAVVGEPGMSGRPTGTYEFRGDDETVHLAVWNTDSPGPETESRFAGRDLPAFDGESTLQWFHDADESTQAYVEPSTERLELDGLVEFEVVNHSHEMVRCGHWNAYKLVDGEWFHVGPLGHTADCRALHPGERKTWWVRAFNGDPVACGSDCHRGFTRGYLGGGEYAAVAGYGHPTDESAALVEFVGDPVDVVPTGDATVERDADAVTVTTDEYGNNDEVPDASLSLTRIDDADDRLIAEQLMDGTRFRNDSPYSALRNALAVFDSDVEEVVVRTDVSAVNRSVDWEAETRRFRFRGQAYEATADRPDE